MFDIAYIAEATICAAQKEKERLWDVVLKQDLNRSLAGFVQMLQMAHFDDIILYWSVMFGTHGV